MRVVYHKNSIFSYDTPLLWYTFWRLWYTVGERL